VRDAAAAPGDLLLLERVDQVDGRVETRSLAVLGDGSDAERGGEVRLAGSRAADQHDVLRGVCELAGSELGDETPIHTGRFEVEAGEIAVYGEAGRVHLVANRSQRAVRAFGLEQVLDQPA
jgi:hypothetical protein